MCGSMVDIQSVTTEIRREKKRVKPQGKNMMSASATQGGHAYIAPAQHRAVKVVRARKSTAPLQLLLSVQPTAVYARPVRVN